MLLLIEIQSVSNGST